MKRYTIYAVLLICAYVLGVYSGPSVYKKTQVVTEVKTVKEDTKTDKNKVVDEVIIKHPDGTIETKRKITTDTKKVTRTDSKDQSLIITKEVKENLPSNQITLLYGPKSVPQYGIVYQRRIFSSLYGGGYIMNNKISPEFGLAITLGF